MLHELIIIMLELVTTIVEMFRVYLNYIILNPIAMLVINIIMILAFIVWSIFSGYHILGLIAYKRYKPLMSEKKADAEMVIVSVGDSRVKDSLTEAIEHNSSYGRISVLTEEDAELIDYIRMMDVNIITIPRNYRRDLIGKGRALNYFSEYIARDDRWYIFLDDDNLLLDNNIFYEIDAYDRLGYVAANPILQPRLGRSKITYMMDWMRYFDDLLTFKFFTGLLSRPLIGMHGEMFTIKGSILREIGFKHKTLTEDFRFSCELVKKGYKTWQSSSKVSILSPNSLEDLYRQRSRWFNGLVHDVNTSTPLMKLLVWMKLCSWMIGIFGSWAFSPLWVLFEPFWYAIIGGIIYWYIYMYGIKKLGEFRYIILIPIFGIIESFSWIKGLRCKEYVVIDKNKIELAKTID